ncbi:FlxA-like family protein [Pseudomonas sp. R76]|nr:FlxA-like family protein [Pseudomonas sp. R76]
MIRELRKQLAEKMAQLSAAMNDTTMSPEARQAKVAGLQGDIANIQAGLMTAQAQLAKSLKDEPPEAQMEAMKLLSK